MHVENGGQGRAKWQLSFHSTQDTSDPPHHNKVKSFTRVGGTHSVGGHVVNVPEGGLINVNEGSGPQFNGIVAGVTNYFESGLSFSAPSGSFLTPASSTRNMPACTLTLTLPNDQYLGKIALGSNNEVKVTTSSPELKAEELEVDTRYGIFLPPVRIEKRLKLHSVSGDINAENARARRYDTFSASGRTRLTGSFPQEDSVIGSQSGNNHVEFSGKSKEGAILRVENMSGINRLDFNDFEGSYEAHTSSGRNVLSRPDHATEEQMYTQSAIIGNSG